MEYTDFSARRKDSSLTDLAAVGRKLLQDHDWHSLAAIKIGKNNRPILVFKR